MPPDVCALVRRDHDDLDRALVAMVDSATAVGELVSLLDVFKLALAVHVAAEAKVLITLLDQAPGSLPLRAIAEKIRDEHAEQQRGTDALASTRPGSQDWYARALELRVAVLDHAAQSELMRWTLQDQVALAAHGALASQYATERLRVLSRTSLVALARAQLAESYR